MLYQLSYRPDLWIGEGLRIVDSGNSLASTNLEFTTSRRGDFDSTRGSVLDVRG